MIPKYLNSVATSISFFPSLAVFNGPVNILFGINMISDLLDMLSYYYCYTMILFNLLFFVMRTYLQQ